MKWTALQPLLQTEVEPGEAVRLALNMKHPFTVEEPLSVDRTDLYRAMVEDPAKFMAERAHRLEEWTRWAKDHRQEALTELRAIEDPLVRDLYLKNGRNEDYDFGDFVHFPLCRALAAAAGSKDRHYVDEFKNGMHIVGEVKKSHRWPVKECVPEISMVNQRSWAWAIR